jgi:hypothetical protein
MAKCLLVMDINPKATMISVRAESKLKITSLDNRDRWRCEDTVDRVRSAMISCGCVRAVSFQENFAEAGVTNSICKCTDIFISIDEEDNLIAIVGPLINCGQEMSNKERPWAAIKISRIKKILVLSVDGEWA